MKNDKHARIAALYDYGALSREEQARAQPLEALYGNRLRGLPDSLRACRRLKKINLFRNPIDRVPEVLFALPALEQILLPDEIPEADRQRLSRAFPAAEIR